jgi:DNA excision repair protein ERCC-2
MKFCYCPKCENLLYPSKNGLYCKFCDSYQNLNDNNSVLKQVSSYKKKEDKNVDLFEDLEEIKWPSAKKTEVPLIKGINYLTFFPYDNFREDQERIIREIEDSGRNKKNILLMAPNGTGKTIIALSALLPVAIEKDLKIIYMCRTHSQNARVIRELNKISKILIDKGKKININGLSIRGRNEMCLNKTLSSLNLNPREAMSVCSDLRKNKNCVQYSNLLKKRNELDKPILIAPELFEKPVDAEELLNFCKEKNICPYFLCKFLLQEMRVIICNYQWIFNPEIKTSFLQFIETELQNCILIIDECHNIVDIATEVNSDKISPYSLKIALKDLEMYQAPIKMRNFVELLLDHFEKKKASLKEEEQAINPEDFLKKLYEKSGFADLNSFKNLLEEINEFSESIHEEKISNGEISRDYLGSFAEFWIKWINTYHLDNYFFCYTMRDFEDKKKSIAIEIVALDPREISVPILSNCYACLNLSGTVNPYVFNYLIGLNESGKSYKAIMAGSPFKKENIKAIITEGVDTKNENRTSEMFKKMIEKIDEILYSTPANVGIFCASYNVLSGLLENGIEDIAKKNKKRLFVEESGASASEYALILDGFKSMAKIPNGGGVLLGVCGGRYSEGEDYPGDEMNSVIIAGFPYHIPSPRVQAKIDYYNKKFNNQGWNFAYLYPAIQRANQAGGRTIRLITDKGAIIFMDSRFKTKISWISDWIRRELEIIPDKENELIQHIYPFWHPK